MRKHLAIRVIDHGIDRMVYPGWERLYAYTLAEGVEMARAQQPDVIAIVIDHPDLPGVIATLHEAAPRAGILVVTDLALDEAARQAVFEAGAILLYEAGWRARRAELTFEEANRIAIDINESVARVASERHRSRPLPN